MQVARQVILAGNWSQAALDCVTLDYESRHRRRIVLTCDSGRELLLDLAEPARLRDGDALLTEHGPVRVRAAAEPLLELRTDSQAACVRLAWHLGNRHVPAQLGERWVRIRSDHVLAELAGRLGATVVPVTAAFDPEPGAYAGDAHAGGASGRAPWR
jgi:urease accessory protein